MAQDRSMEARQGRNNQRYGAQGERLVAGVVPLSTDKAMVLVIQSTRRGAWVLPKGGWELDEGTAQDAACREAWEEAGIVCRVQRDLGTIHESNGNSSANHNQNQQNPQAQAPAPKAIYQFFEVAVEEEKQEWPEMHKRARKWLSYTEAALVLRERPELIEALHRSSIVR